MTVYFHDLLPTVSRALMEELRIIDKARKSGLSASMNPDLDYIGHHTTKAVMKRLRELEGAET